MDEGAAQRSIPPPVRPGRRRWLPFWGLQVTEIVIALVLVDISIHVHSGGLLVGAAVLLMMLAATADGPLGIVRVCSPRLHLVLVVVAAVLIGLAPVIPAVRPDIQGIVVLEFGMVGLIRFATLTKVADTAKGMRIGMPHRSSVIDATATVSSSPTPSSSSPSPSTPSSSTREPNRNQRAHGSGRTSDPPSSSSTDDAARWAGRMPPLPLPQPPRAAKRRPSTDPRPRPTSGAPSGERAGWRASLPPAGIRPPTVPVDTPVGQASAT